MLTIRHIKAKDNSWEYTHNVYLITHLINLNNIFFKFSFLLGSQKVNTRTIFSLTTICIVSEAFFNLLDIFVLTELNVSLLWH